MREASRAYGTYENSEWNCRVSNVCVSYSEETSAREEAALAALTRRCNGRGFYRAAEQHKQEMETMEEEARTQSPDYYRWDEMCADGRGDQFRHGNYLGKKVMDVDDFAAYFETCRTRRMQNTTSAVTAQAQETKIPARTRDESSFADKNRALVAQQKREERSRQADRLIAVAKDWLKPDDPAYRCHGKRRTIPVSVISVLVVITISLMLIISSTVMVAGVERDVSNLSDEVVSLQREAEFATDRVEASLNYLEIYKIATEHYGMIPAVHADSIYMDQTTGNTIESFEDDGEGKIEFGTLLSAIGIHIGPFGK